ncbi:acyl-CoA dehydrogenase family protein [Acidiferrimicrobium sp. IK]|uniref:acyl-CoA dehydrogenase family protein n=1 Tax=Acidiferrimicrobium sp. IK TaxID=2871700 RepID=UPI0021CB4C34|nr:acyl-CoA dehydrogenase family protein [Acidiferrimicrobium sp. IK]MCU4184315.1 acyl-CoA dehydrogenase family protein [Acidiferrimicrobium sp. IK]
MTLTEEQKAFRTAVRHLAEDKIAPNAAHVDATGEFPWDNFKALNEMELPALGIPEAYGGSGADHVTQAIMVEELARVCGSTSLMMALNGLSTTPIINWASEELKAKYLPRIASGEAQGSYCLSEADAGSDVAAMKARAVRDGDSYVLSGSKYWISGATISDIYVVFAKTDPAAGARGVSAFIVERDMGLRFGALEDKMGMKGSPTAEVILDGVRVPAANLIGEEGQGFRIAMHTLDRTRCAIAAQAVGLAQGAIDQAVAYVKQREAFGKPIAEFQGLQFMLADMAMKTEAARTLTYRANAIIDEGDPDGELSAAGAMAKAFASDTAMAVTTDGVQLLGGYGYTKGFPLERFMRDAKITQIYEGTNQIQRVVIARSLLR